MRQNERWLKYWFVASLSLMLVGIALASSRVEFDSTLGLVFRAIFGLTTALVVIGFYFTMLAENLRSESGRRRVIAVVSFIIFPILSAFSYYAWTRYVRPHASL